MILEKTIEQAWLDKSTISREKLIANYEASINQAISWLESGKARVADPLENGEWQVNEWLKNTNLKWICRENRTLEVQQ